MNNNKREMVFCEPCSYKFIVEGKLDLQEISRVDIPGGAPVFDKEEKKTKIKKTIPQKKMVKCPKCGRGVLVKSLSGAYSKAYEKLDKENLKLEKERLRKQRMEDGKPPERKETEFTG